MKIPEINQAVIIKAIIVLVIALALFFAVRKFVKTVKDDKYEKDLKDEIEADKLTYPLNQYVAFADQLHDAMAYLGTKTTMVNSIFTKMNTLSDVLQLIIAFGVRKYYGIWGEKSLPQWISEELSQNEIEKVNTILKSKNINFSF
jgi:hypothetical protein